MKLHIDLFRGILLYLEEQNYYITRDDGDVEGEPVWFGNIVQAFPSYSPAEIYYALKNLEQAGLINLTSCRADNAVSRCYVNFITFQGHEFLSSIKNEERWSGIKKIIPSVRDFSLEAVKAIAEGMTACAISAYFLLPRTECLALTLRELEAGTFFRADTTPVHAR